MFSLRTFHLLFILAAIVISDMFGAWAVWSNSHTPDRAVLIAGIMSFVLGFALVVYLVWAVRKLDKAHVE